MKRAEFEKIVIDEIMLDYADDIVDSIRETVTLSLEQLVYQIAERLVEEGVIKKGGVLDD